MDPGENYENQVADYLARSQNTGLGCSSDICSVSSEFGCPNGLLCHDLWRYGECRFDFTDISLSFNSLHCYYCL